MQELGAADGACRVLPASVVEWAAGVPIMLDGRAFGLAGHEYQREMLECEAPRQVFMKGAQMGITSILMLKTLHGMLRGRYPQGVLCLFPTVSDVSDFSRGRFGPLLRDNPSIAGVARDTDAVNIKRIGGAMLYFRGARATRAIRGMKKTSSALKSIPVDRIVFDERDEMDPAMVDLALERVAHSAVKEEVHVSTPSVPDYGVDLLYGRSDRRVWMIRCGACNGDTCLEAAFPECLREGADGRVMRVCSRCGREIDPALGRWVAECPSRSGELVGWWISQLNSRFVDPGRILELYRHPPEGNLAEVFNSKLGRAFVEATDRLTLEDVLGLCGDEGMGEVDSGPCTMGVDQGKDLHVVVGKPHWRLAGQVVHLGVYREWEDLDRLMDRFSVGRCVVDALPETRNARAFAGRHRGRVFLCFYSEGRGDARWNEGEMTVSCGRTESLDASHHEVLAGELVLPKVGEVVKEFARHMANTAKRLEERPGGGNRYVYLKLGADHFRHAYNYECLARRYGREGYFGDFGG